MLRNDPALENTGAEAFALVEQRRRRRTRRRLGLWGAFLLVGLLLGTIYATGFATTGGATGTAGDAAANNNTPAANQDTSELAGLLTTTTADLSYDWAGRWGSVSSAVMYEADLTGFTGTDLFFTEVVLTNTPSGFSDLQLQLRVAADGGDGCDIADLTGTATTNYRVMIFDADDAQVTFSGLLGATSGLPGGAKYCMGIIDYAGPPASGKDSGGTFIRKSTAGSTFGGDYPEFVATLNRMT